MSRFWDDEIVKNLDECVNKVLECVGKMNILDRTKSLRKELKLKNVVITPQGDLRGYFCLV